jgi:hypothetical protein
MIEMLKHLAKLRRSCRTTLTVAFTLSLAGGVANAAVVAFERTTAGQPTFNRALEDFSALSGVGTAVSYDVQSFTVDASGEYSFVGNSTFDSFFYLYQGAFDATMPLSNGLAANDDLSGFGTSGVAYDLVAGQEYFAVMTAFNNAEFGEFALSVAGPGEVAGLSSNAASDQVAILSGATGGASMFNRALDDFSGLSGVGTGVAYDVVEFTVAASGAYALTTVSEFDAFLFLYGGFDATSPLTNGLFGNDDLVSLASSGGTADLLAGVTYQAVITGFTNNDFGDYVLTLAGPSDIDFAASGVIPEPSSWAVMILGLASIGAMARRRRDGKTVSF